MVLFGALLAGSDHISEFWQRIRAVASSVSALARWQHLCRAPYTQLEMSLKMLSLLA